MQVVQSHNACVKIQNWLIQLLNSIYNDLPYYLLYVGLYCTDAGVLDS